MIQLVSIDGSELGSKYVVELVEVRHELRVHLIEDRRLLIQERACIVLGVFEALQI